MNLYLLWYYHFESRLPVITFDIAWYLYCWLHLILCSKRSTALKYIHFYLRIYIFLDFAAFPSAPAAIVSWYWYRHATKRFIEDLYYSMKHTLARLTVSKCIYWACKECFIWNLWYSSRHRPYCSKALYLVYNTWVIWKYNIIW